MISGFFYSNIDQVTCGWSMSLLSGRNKIRIFNTNVKSVVLEDMENYKVSPQNRTTDSSETYKKS